VRGVTWLAAALALLPSPALADALVDNVNGVALDRQGRVVRFTGLLMTLDGKVTKLLRAGDKRPEKLDWRADMKGRVLVPGMIDAHGHVMDLGFRALSLDLFETTSLAQAQGKIAAYAAANGQRAWITGGGWNQEVWKLGRFPTAAELDAVVADRPVWLSRTARRCARPGSPPRRRRRPAAGSRRTRAAIRPASSSTPPRR
jgi:hypothetical protein